MHHTLLEERPLSHIPEKNGMEIPFSKEDPILGRFPIHVDEEEGNNADRSRVDLAPHAEVCGAHAPTRGVLVPLQIIPQDLICGDQVTTHDQHVPWLTDCETMQMEGGGGEDDQHHLMRSTHPYLFQRFDEHKKEIGLCSEGKGNSIHLYIQSTLDVDVSLHRGISPRRPPDQQMMRD